MPEKHQRRCCFVISKARRWRKPPGNWAGVTDPCMAVWSGVAKAAAPADKRCDTFRSGVGALTFATSGAGGGTPEINGRNDANRFAISDKFIGIRPGYTPGGDDGGRSIEIHVARKSKNGTGRHGPGAANGLRMSLALRNAFAGPAATVDSKPSPQGEPADESRHLVASFKQDGGATQCLSARTAARCWRLAKGSRSLHLWDTATGREMRARTTYPSTVLTVSIFSP